MSAEWRTEQGVLLRCRCDRKDGIICVYHSEKVKWDWLLSLGSAPTPPTHPTDTGEAT